MSSLIFLLIILLIFACFSNAIEFYNDYEDNDISNWEEEWGTGTRWAADGQSYLKCTDYLSYPVRSNY